ncbi:sugar ABC transporter substrate-binding protein [Longispora sp. NPDC051575]|uniref:ABC transporter substrate-binding protein n=1 Tax=Longispora sp. NPDC051575 TaxID=3154943 RepID=UPI0034329569
MRIGAVGLAVLLLGTACTAAKDTASKPGCDKVVTLNLLRAQDTPPAPSVLKDWEAAHPCIEIKVSEVPFGQLADKINVIAGSPTPPDVYTYDGPNTATYASRGVIAPMDAAITAAIRADIIPATIKEHTYEGRLYSPGIRQSALALIYNKDMLDKLGITPPDSLDKAWTWDQAIDAMRKCQVGPAGNAKVWGLAPTQSGNGTPGPSYVSLNFLRSAGDPKADQQSSLYKTFWALAPDGKTINGWLNTPEAARGAQIYQDIFNKYGISPKAGIPNAYADGKACFDIQQPSYIGKLLAPDATFKTGVTPLPYVTTPITQTGSLTLGVGARSKHPKEAAEFVMFVASGPEQLKNSQGDHSMPVLKSLFTQLPQYDSYPLAIYRNELEQWGQPRPPGPHYAQYDSIVTSAMRDIAYGGDVAATLDKAVKQFEQIAGKG